MDSSFTAMAKRIHPGAWVDSEHGVFTLYVPTAKGFLSIHLGTSRVTARASLRTEIAQVEVRR